LKKFNFLGKKVLKNEKKLNTQYIFKNNEVQPRLVENTAQQILILDRAY
jgi:hypothetical protein